MSQLPPLPQPQAHLQNERKRRIFQELKHGCALAGLGQYRLNSGAWREGLQGFFFLFFMLAKKVGILSCL